MNTLMLVALAFVLFCYCGGKYCPKVLSSNKEMLLGVLVGIALCSFTCLKFEGFDNNQLATWKSNDCCNSNSPKCRGLITEVNNSGDIVNTSRIINDNCPPSPRMSDSPPRMSNPSPVMSNPSPVMSDSPPRMRNPSTDGK